MLMPLPVFSFRPALLYCVFCSFCAVSSPLLAMSSSPEDETNAPFSVEDARAEKYGEQFPGKDPVADAQAAIEKGDLRLLGFATRVTSVPGINKAIRKSAIEACGVRLIKGFGDVIRSEAELSAMQLASRYAKRYNAVIVETCLKKSE